MQIAQIAPLTEPIPPKLYGGTERVISWLADELVALGHDVVFPDVEYIGEINDGEKSRYLSGAIALLAPIAWPEPFGLVLIEAMACGTPVIAFNRGSVPEIVEDGLTAAARYAAAGRGAADERRRRRVPLPSPTQCHW